MRVRYCGREFSPEEIAWIRQLIEESPETTRAALSRLVCERLQWRKPDGGLKEMSCRVAMLRMQRDGVIRLPPSATGKRGGRWRIQRTLAGEPGFEISGSVGELDGLHVEVVRTRGESHLWNEYIDRYHYLGYKALPGAQLRYMIWGGEEVIGCLGFGAAAWKVACRDEWIGWRPEQRKERLHLIVNNARFLLLPWVRVQNLATKVLAIVVRQLPKDWEQRYAYRPVLLETFVEIERFRGTCYKAANWTYLGLTQGRGRNDVHTLAQEPIKSVWAYPLARRFREILCAP